jgi:RNA polymerase sigma factor, sigma-70 family
MTDAKVQDELLEVLQDEYLPKIYGFCRLKLGGDHDAEELAGEIALQIVKYIRGGAEIENLGALVWKVSSNTLFKLFRKNKNANNTMYLTELIPSGENVESDVIGADETRRLRRELSLMPDKYRKCVILHYFDGKTCEEIANIVHSPAGTVKWWLHEGKKQIEEGMNIMREYGEKSYNPSVLAMSCQNTPGENMEPMSCAKRMSAQNILLAAYKTAMSVQELSLELGIPAPYIEDEAEYLTSEQLMKKTGDKYQTDFVIIKGNNTDIVDKVYETCIPGYYRMLMSILEEHKHILTSREFNPANFTWERLLWMYIHLFTDINLSDFKIQECKIVHGDAIPERPHGGNWIAIGWDNEPSSAEKMIKTYKEYYVSDGPVHKINSDSAQGFFHHYSGTSSAAFFDIPNGVFALCREIIKGKKQIETLGEDDKLLFSHAVESGLYLKTNDGFKLNYCYIGEAQMKQIKSICDGFYSEASEHFRTAHALITDEYKKQIPKQVQWQMGNLLSNQLGVFVNGTLHEAYKANKLSRPDEQNKTWLSLFATE